MVLVKNWPLFHISFFGSLDQENIFYNILERKNAILGYENMKLKKSKNYDVSKGVSPWFWSTNGYFLMFSFYSIYTRKMCFMILQSEKTQF